MRPHTPSNMVYGHRVRMNVAQLAKAQGLRDDFESLQRLRRGRGISSPDALCTLSSYLKRVLGIQQETESYLTQGLRTLNKLIESSPPHERELLRMSFNIEGRLGDFDWLDRTENFSRQYEWGGSSRNVRHQADIALLQLLVRTLPASEAEPIPSWDGGVAREPGTEPGTDVSASNFFTEDYVRNSPRFNESWKVSRCVDICGFGHNRMAVAYSVEIGQMLRAGGQVRVLAQDPEGRSVLEANRRSSTPKAHDEAVRHQHRSGISTLEAIRIAAGSDQLQLRLYDIMPPFTGYFFDPNAESAHAYIWFWSWRQPSAWRPGFLVRGAADPLWYKRFHDQFEEMWADGETREFVAGRPQ